MPAPNKLANGDQVPHFTVTTVNGEAFSYSSIWQSKNLVLMVLPGSDQNAGRTLEELRRIETPDTRSVVTTDVVPGLDAPATLVADKWGEIAHVVHAPDELPTGDDLADWIEHVRQRCPECEGEAR